MAFPGPRARATRRLIWRCYILKASQIDKPDRTFQVLHTNSPHLPRSFLWVARGFGSNRVMAQFSAASRTHFQVR